MPSMVSRERMRSRISACQPCKMSSFKNMVLNKVASGPWPVKNGSRPFLAIGYWQPLLDVNISRSRSQNKLRPATAHFADDPLARVLDPPLDGHGHRRIHVQLARTSGEIGVEGGICGQPYTHIARSGADPPGARLRALG